MTSEANGNSIQECLKNRRDAGGLRVIDLSKDHSYQGPLAKVIFGNADGAHVTVHLSDYTATLHLDGREYYYIDLERIQTGAQLADWIFQIASKSWAGTQIKGLLVLALNEAFNPQSCLCSFGQNLEIPRESIRPLIERNLRRLIGWCRADANPKINQIALIWE